jgi:transcriptional regulator with XRE-family HTH domain
MGAVKRMIGEKLERELAARGWDQKELAARTGVNEATISRHINNKRVPTTEIVTKYAPFRTLPPRRGRRERSPGGALGLGSGAGGRGPKAPSGPGASRRSL